MFYRNENSNQINGENISLGCKTTTNCVLGGSALGSKKESCFDSGKRAASEIVNLIPIGACVDEHVQVWFKWKYTMHWANTNDWIIISRINW